MLDYREPTAVTHLRTRLRDLVADAIPPSFLGAFTDDPADLAVAERFCQRLGAERLLALAWPAEFGGAGADIWQQTALREEMWAVHEPRGAQYMGLNWVGPVIMRYGTPDQHRRHLPPISAGEVIWCQGFSEPGAGSDLPALRTRAVRDGSGWRITGQKVWTSYASMAQRCFLLARTGPEGGRKAGITVFLVDMDQPGVQVRPIASMVGPHHLNEVFFDDVWVPGTEVLGDVDDGWSIVSDVLAFERVGIARYARCERLLNLAAAELGPRWDALPDGLRSRWATALLHTRQSRLLAYRVLTTQDVGDLDPADAAAYRIVVTLADQESAEVLMDLLDNWSLGTPDLAHPLARAVEDHWRYAQASTVASGALEMQQQLLVRSITSRAQHVGGHRIVTTELAADAVAVGDALRRALQAAGGVDLLRRAAAAPDLRAAEVASLLDAVGAWDIAVYEDQLQFEAAAALCRAAGEVALPYPVAERLARTSGADATAFVATDPGYRLVNHADLPFKWTAVDLSGRGYTITDTSPALRSVRLAPFCAPVRAEPTGADNTATGSVLHVLQGWWLLGLLHAAVRDTTRYTGERQQFGRPLTAFQAAGFRLADITVALRSLEELAKYTLWSVAGGQPPPVASVDALALRVAALEAANTVLRGAHQLHGAMGFTDEVDVSWLSRASQPMRRLPEGYSRTTALLADRVRRHGFTGVTAAAEHLAASPVGA